MNDEFVALSALMLLLTVIPAWVLVWLLKPRPFRYLLRGGEGALCFAWALDGTRRLVFILLGVRVDYPGDVAAVVHFLALAVVALLLWGRLDRVLRHRARNLAHQRENKMWLKPEQENM